MQVSFEVEYLPDVLIFLKELDQKAREKIFFNIAKSQLVLDSQLFKKLNDVIWEFRTSYNGMAYRLFSFWDVSNSGRPKVVVVTHGIRKKTQRIPAKEILRAEAMRKQFLQERNKHTR